MSSSHRKVRNGFGDLFLSNPDVFPNSSSGEPWGKRRLIVDFVGGPYLITGLNKEQDAQLRNHFEDSCSELEPGQQASVIIQVFKAPSSDFKEIEISPWELTFDLDHRQEYLRVAGLHVMARLDFQPCIAAALWTSRSSESDFPSNIFENIFRMAVTYRLHENGGMLVHSAGVVDNGSAVLFPGRSNDGKSTLSKLSLRTGRTVLSDDMNALTWVDGRPMVEKVPFSGDLGRTWTRSDQYPLKGIFSIHKTAEITIGPLVPSQAVALLVASAPYLNSDTQRMTDLLANIHRLAQSVPTGQLGFRTDQDCWPEIINFLSQQETI